jgi:hypothetical protein
MLQTQRLCDTGLRATNGARHAVLAEQSASLNLRTTPNAQRSCKRNDLEQGDDRQRRLNAKPERANECSDRSVTPPSVRDVSAQKRPDLMRPSDR